MQEIEEEIVEREVESIIVVGGEKQGGVIKRIGLRRLRENKDKGIRKGF